jgi:hypothetical protein
MNHVRREAIARVLFLAGIAFVGMVAVVALLILLAAVRVGSG